MKLKRMKGLSTLLAASLVIGAIAPVHTVSALADPAMNSDSTSTAVQSATVTDSAYGSSGSIDGVSSSGGSGSVQQPAGPIVNPDGTVTFRIAYEGPSLYLVGSMNGWDNTGIPMAEESPGIFSVTIPLSPGTYSYRFLPHSGSWSDVFSDAANTNPRDGDNSVVYVPGLVIETSQIVIDTSVQLKAVRYSDKGEKSEVSPVWLINQPVEGVTLENGSLSITPQSSLKAGDTLIVTAFLEGMTISRPLDVLAKNFRTALMDAGDTIYAVSNVPVSDEALQGLQLRDVTSSVYVDIHASKVTDTRIQLHIEDPSSIDVRHAYQVQGTNYVPTKVIFRNVLNDSRYYYSGNDLGVTYGAASSTFKLWAPTAQNVTLKLYDTYTENKEGGTDAAMTRSDEGVWSAQAPGNLAGKYYMYKLEFADGTVTYALDPYARASSVNSRKSAVIDLNATNPEGWKPGERPRTVHATDAVIYELHTRDFSMDSNSGIPADERGKFAAFTKTGTTLPGNPAIHTGIDHLKELGITHVQLLPFYDFGAVDETKVDDPAYTGRKFNWGYDPVNYNVPEGSYATHPEAEDPSKRIREFKEMIQALHDQGIGVVLDVVYNHTWTFGLTDDYSVFDKIVPGYFYRTDDQGVYTNGSGVNNDVASERPMVRKFIKDSAKYLAEQYNIDGYRFDLFGAIDKDTISQISNELKDQIDPSMITYGEPWTGGPTALPAGKQTLKGAQKGERFAVFNDNFRGAIKGDSDGSGKGFATGDQGREAGIVTGVRGSITDFTSSPTETINYVTVHDNLNLWDKVLTTQGVPKTSIQANPFAGVDPAHLFDNETVKRSLLANGIVMTSQGIALFQAGDEFLRSKFGDQNSYASSDDINMLRWSQKETYKPVFDYYKGMIELRKQHPAFRMTTAADIDQNLQVLQQDNQVVAFQLKNYANADRWNNIVVIYNGNTAPVETALPANKAWNVVVDDTQAGVTPLRTIQGDSAEVPGLSMLVLYDEERNVDSEVTSIDLGASVIGVDPGSYRVLNAIVKDQTGAALTEQQITWSSSNEDVVSITSSGRMHAVSTGTATVTAQIGDVKRTVTVHVEPLLPAKISLTGSSSVFATRTLQLSASVFDQFDQTLSDVPLTWATSDSTIATVNTDGAVTGLREGTVTITARSGNAQGTMTITVRPVVKRYVDVVYQRPDQDYSDWNLWVWDTGMVNGQFDVVPIKNGLSHTIIEIAPETTSIGFVLRKGTDWSTSKQDVPDDRRIQIDPNETFTKVNVTSMVPAIGYYPVLKGPVIESGKVQFDYRDEALYQSEDMDQITSVKLKLDGQLYPMTYIPAEERFVYTWSQPTSGTHTYTYLVTKDNTETEINDPKNLKDGKSVVVIEGSGSGNGNGGSPGSSHSGSSGTSSSSTNQPENENALVLSVSLDDVKPDSNGKVILSLPEGKTELQVPLGAAALLAAKPLEVHATGIKLVIPAQVLKELEASVPKELAQGAVLALQITAQPDSAVVTKLKASQPGNGNVQYAAASGLYELRLVAKDNKGKEYELDHFDQPVQLTLQVKAGVDKEIAGMYGIHDSGQPSYLGGTWEGNFLHAEVPHFSTYGILEYSKTFEDLPKEHWSYRAIRSLTSKHILEGATDTQFVPERRVTRAEFTAMLVRTLGLQNDEEAASTYADVDLNDWFASAVSAARKAGLVDGRTDDTFEPQGLITREEMAVMLMRAWKMHAKEGAGAAEFESKVTHSGQSFSDQSDISQWALESILAGRSLGILKEVRTAPSFLKVLQLALKAQLYCTGCCRRSKK
ncbi:type I pullulanase [Paenibacillus hexagrammi]|uniref:pullulanase n=1 Tax=Paenibacillus hexagrammi TaxID=2908839 RepID=A0ABY3SEL8_9BACL|nr:type I pullulanase [Paenibacillus sp. YPD9-1]UJF31880.1 type I pullulanase [Paenibacillus sp. YPD9-1]